MKRATKECPCHSGKRFAECCAPYLRGEREAPSAEALMRSRYAAFSLGEVEYLHRTLASSHADSAHPKESVLTALRASSAARFLGLAIREHVEEGDVAYVTFDARVFEKGRDRSFSERSRFVREGGAWRYESGETSPTPAASSSPDRSGR